MQITRKEKGVTQVVTENWKRKNTDGKRYSSSDKQAGRERRREGRRRDRVRTQKKNVSIMECCGSEQLQAKKRHVVAG